MQTSERTKGPSLGKIEVNVPHQRSPCALKFEDRSQEETERQEGCACGDAWRLARVSWGSERERACLLLTYQRMVSPSAIRNNTGRKRICCRFWSINAHVEQEKPELCRVGKRQGIRKSDDGCYSQRRSANKRRSDRECQRFGFFSDSEASRRYTGRSLTRKTLRRSRIFLRVDHWSETTTPERGRRIKCSTENYVPIVDPGLSTGSSSSATPTSPASVPQEAVVPTMHPASTRSESTSSTVRVSASHEPAETEKNK